MNRFRRWCVSRTLRDLRLSATRRRLMSLPNALRLLHRRWSQAPGDEDGGGDDGPEKVRSRQRQPLGLTAPWADALQPPDLAAARRRVRAAYRSDLRDWS